ncbi:hypothetical protein LZ31DRAFT_259821 [Colletotrichum somersetense]|nr:hypothetical protein LZ31DRAFT_259821 [Colletotrichum somersetense]
MGRVQLLAPCIFSVPHKNAYICATRSLDKEGAAPGRLQTRITAVPRVSRTPTGGTFLWRPQAGRNVRVVTFLGLINHVLGPPCFVNIRTSTPWSAARNTTPAANCTTDDTPKTSSRATSQVAWSFAGWLFAGRVLSVPSPWRKGVPGPSISIHE